MSIRLKKRIKIINEKAPVNNKDLTCGLCIHFHHRRFKRLKDQDKGKDSFRRLCAKFRRVAASEPYKIARCHHTKFIYQVKCLLYGKKVYPMTCAINFEKGKRFCWKRCGVYK